MQESKGSSSQSLENEPVTIEPHRRDDDDDDDTPGTASDQSVVRSNPGPQQLAGTVSGQVKSNHSDKR